MHIIVKNIFVEEYDYNLITYAYTYIGSACSILFF